MENVYDYLRWRGDLNMLQSPLNEIDAYILSKFGTLKLQDIIPPEGGLTVSETMLRFEKAMEGLTEEEVRGHSSPNNLTVMRILPGTVRFRSLVVSDYVKDIREEEDLQFSAVTFDLPDGRKMVTFRGTDTPWSHGRKTSSLLSWMRSPLSGMPFPI